MIDLLFEGVEVVDVKYHGDKPIQGVSMLLSDDSFLDVNYISVGNVSSVVITKLDSDGNMLYKNEIQALEYMLDKFYSIALEYLNV